MYVYNGKTTSQNNYPGCFFQIESFQCKKPLPDEHFYFSQNRADYSGSSLYKDAFNNCSMGGRLFGEFELFDLISNIRTTDVGSLVQPCYCERGHPDCSKQIPYANIKPGQKLILDIAIADR